MSNTKQIVTINELNELVTTLIAKIDAQQATIEELKSKIDGGNPWTVLRASLLVPPRVHLQAHP